MSTPNQPNSPTEGPLSPLRVNVEGDELVIRIGVKRLDALTGISTLVVIDPHQFAKDMATEMRREEEDGNTITEEFLNKAATLAIDNGSSAVK